MADLSKLRPGLNGAAEGIVTPSRTATEMGSGTIAVFATPAMVALMEAAAVDCVEHLLPEGHASLGTHLDVTHIAPTPPGARVTARAEITAVDGRQLTFRVEARDEHEVIGRGSHTRVVVDVARFTSKIARKAGAGAA